MGQSNAAFSQAPAPLPPAAQEAFDKGIIAAKVPDYLLALRYFEDARKAAPDAAIIYLNLGIAESKIPSRELRAIAWLGAYLAAYPDAPNAASVKAEIGMMEVKSESISTHLIREVQNAAGQNEDFLGDVAGLWAKAGDVTEALKIADSLRSNDKFARPYIKKSAALNKISRAQIGNGDLAGSHMTADLIQDMGEKSATLLLVAEAQIQAGDIAGAKSTLEAARISNDANDSRTEMSRCELRRSIAVLQAKGGDPISSHNTLASDMGTAEQMGDSNLLSYAYSDIAASQLKSGDIAGTQKTLSRAEAAAELIKKQKDIGISVSGMAEKARYDIATVRSNLVEAQAKAGDFAGALTTADLVQDDEGTSPYPRRSFTLLTISEAQAKSGDMGGAQKTVALIAHPGVKDQAVEKIAKAKADAGVPARASANSSPASQSPARAAVSAADWIKKLDDTRESGSNCPLKSKLFLDLAGYLKSLPSADDPRQVFESLRGTAEKYIGAQNIVVGVLKQQAAR